MPMINVLPAILAKSSLLALAAGLAANYFKRISIPILMLAVFSYQVAGRFDNSVGSNLCKLPL
jgi:hypothetical protein